MESPGPGNLMSKQHRVNPTIPFAKLQAAGEGSVVPVLVTTSRSIPYVATTYRLAEHWQTGVMTRPVPWLLEMQPQMFVEMDRELAAKKGIHNGDMVEVTSPRGRISCPRSSPIASSP